MLSFCLMMIDSEEEKIKFELLYDLYKKRMWYVANQVLNDPLEAEDAVHDAFIGIAKNIHHIDDPYSKKTLAYVVTASKHSAINIATRSKDRIFYKLEDFKDIPDDEAMKKLIESENKEILINALKEMPELYRDLLYFRYYQEMSEKEIAAQTGANYSTVRKQISRARKLLCELLTKEVVSFE